MSRRTKRCIYVQRRAALFFGRDTRAGSTFRPLRELVPAAAERPPRPGEGEVVCHWCVTRGNRVRSNCFSLFFLFAFRFIEELSLLLDSGRYCFFFLSPTSFHSRWIQENLPFFVARFFLRRRGVTHRRRRCDIAPLPRYRHYETFSWTLT